MRAATPDLPATRIDPYLAWAEYTDYRDYFRPGARRTLAVAIECEKDVADLLSQIKKGQLKVAISPLYVMDGRIYPGRFCTASVDATEVRRLLPLVE